MTDAWPSTAEKCKEFLRRQANANEGWQDVDENGHARPSQRAARWVAAYDRCREVIEHYQAECARLKAAGRDQ